MRKIVTASFAMFVASGLVSSFASSASALVRYRPGCASCGPIAPTIHTRVVHPVHYVTRYRDVSVVRHVQRIHRVVDMTYVQPVIHVNEVTRVHHHTIVHTRNSYQAVTGQMRPIWSVSHAFHDDYDCGCGH